MNKGRGPKPGKLPDKPTLSVCMIVCNEEKMLPRCLKSVEGIADELIVVDTGSVDNTLGVAKDFGANVFEFQWCDDFSAARNESIRHATGEWIFQMDAENLLSCIKSINTVLDVLPAAKEELLPNDILKKIKAREEARRDKNFALADQIRDELLQKGVQLEDTKDGTRWKII